MKKFFQDLSWAQVFAGALAAVTSFFLAAKIGIAGSAIGVAVGSIVSAVASQLYKNVLDASTQKIQETVISPDGEEEHVEVSERGTGSRAPRHEETAAQILDKQTQVLIPQAAINLQGRISSSVGSSAAGAYGESGPAQNEDDQTSIMPKRVDHDDTKVFVPIAEPYEHGSAVPRSARSSRSGQISTAQSSQSRVRLESVVTPAHTSVQRKKQMVIVVSVVSALVSVLLSAVVINLLTRGEGTDQVVRNIVSPSQSVQTPDTSVPSQQQSAPSQSPDGNEKTSPQSTNPSPSTSATPSPSASSTSSSSSTENNQPSQQASQSARPGEQATPSATPSSGQSQKSQQSQSGQSEQEKQQQGGFGAQTSSPSAGAVGKTNTVDGSAGKAE
ncbi:hypothetical protein KIMH_08440 [Bombiscardovia apis]|uniref:ABC transporter permease n=1 Tax=Bombiscardovia apis TaxID=2932182 RepID=A0ABM8BCT6_9BIFI|nr:hypothetical protein [Bombiscardovia apis]BDR54733.1 hypothetical protein KIMH_08440 [Bombiscardovia apis]